MQHSMRTKIGLSLSNRAVLFGWSTIDDLIEMAVMAEESGGFDGVWVGDNFLSKPRVEAAVVLSALAARTRRVERGASCLAGVPLRHAAPLSRSCAGPY